MGYMEFSIDFAQHEISEAVLSRINGVSYRENGLVPVSDLTYLTLGYWGFDSQLHCGELIVHRTLAREVLYMFQTLAQSRFPIAQMRLIDDFYADDEASMAANNTSALCVRPIGGTDRWSQHSYGAAIDINPVQNPFMTGGRVYPPGSETYCDRENVRPGMIMPGLVCHQVFVSCGWTWGGDWTEPKDYHHFEKPFC